MGFDASPEEMYPEHFPEDEDIPINDPDREPHHTDGSYGWYFRVDHETYGFYRTEAEAWERYEEIRDEVYTDEE